VWGQVAGAPFARRRHTSAPSRRCGRTDIDLPICPRRRAGEAPATPQAVSGALARPSEIADRIRLLRSQASGSTSMPNTHLTPIMQRLTPIEWARAREPITHLSTPRHDPVARDRMIAWLVARAGSSWFYAHADNYHFGSPLDAAAFRMWMASELAA
jgi:hypothetical protein